MGYSQIQHNFKGGKDLCKLDAERSVLQVVHFFSGQNSETCDIYTSFYH